MFIIKFYLKYIYEYVHIDYKSFLGSRTQKDKR